MDSISRFQPLPRTYSATAMGTVLFFLLSGSPYDDDSKISLALLDAKTRCFGYLADDIRRMSSARQWSLLSFKGTMTHYW